MTENSHKEGFDAFLTDSGETEQGVEYIKPDIELKLTAAKRNECREIVREIKSFGVRSQRQILYLIYLLALEVEDPTTMKTLVDSCKVARNELTEVKKLIL